MRTETQMDLARAKRDRPAVLVVDDNDANLVAMDALLSSLEVDVVRASSGEDALKNMLARDFALVLMDIQMPGLDGFQTTALIRQRDRSRHTPIIFLTAIFTDEGSAQKAYSLGAVDYLTKPLNESVLKAKVAALTNHYRQLDLIERQAVALQDKQAETEREHAARREAEAASRSKDEFLAMLSHELRAPLTAIVGWSSRLQERTDLPDDVAKSVDAIARNALSQKKLIDDLLDLSQMVAGKLRLSEDITDLALVAQSALATMAPAALAKRVRLDLDVAPDSLTVLGDAQRLEQVLCALLSNAIKFSENDSVVRVELSRGGPGVQLRVKDVGIGIPPDELPHVFERFRQADGTWARQHGGLGIGLTIAKCLVELHQGSIEAFSAGKGMGAVFVVTLPRDRTPVAKHNVSTRSPQTRARPAAATPLSGLRLLVVDDDDDVRELLATVLTDAGAIVVAVASAGEAVACFNSEPFAVVISDLGMPGEDGLTLIRKLRGLERGRTHRLTAIAVSGYGSDDDRLESARAGFDAHITKPVDGRKLVASIVNLTKRG